MEESQNAVGKFLDPVAIIAQLEVKVGSVVADFGCGPGYFSIPFAKKIGEDGKVYALDILPQALETVSSKARNSAVANITTKRVNFEKEQGTKLTENSVDWIVMKDVLFQNKEKEVILTEAFRILKSGGKIIVVEWNQKSLSVGPAMEIRVPEETLEKMFIAQKFTIEKSIDAGDFHYAFVAVKNGM
ncbi:MAG: class I SAM-dependent methyltransferase [Candidatus Moranbacteria bacterium]|nr:class I SAM-dependent methyltransferase [Candidatus Moranbacteria bacterium]